MTRGREDILLTAGFAAVTAGVILQGAGLSPVARRAPLAVAIPTLALLLLDLGFQLAGKIGARRAPRLWVPGIGSHVASRRLVVQGLAPEAPAERRRELVFLGWAAAALALSAGAGMSTGLALFVLFYLRWQSGRRWRAALVASAATWVVLQGVMRSLLGIRLFEGLWAPWVALPW